MPVLMIFCDHIYTIQHDYKYQHAVLAVRNNSPVCKHLDLGNELPWVLTPFPPGPFSLTLFLSVLFRARLPFLGEGPPIERGASRTPTQSPTRSGPQQRGTQVGPRSPLHSALAGPWLIRDCPSPEGLCPPPLATPGLVASAVTAQVCAVRLSGYPPVCCPMPAAHCRTARPFIPSIHPILPPVPITSHFPSNQ